MKSQYFLPIEPYDGKINQNQGLRGGMRTRIGKRSFSKIPSGLFQALSWWGSKTPQAPSPSR